jgi:hypothetical protein
VVVDGLFAHLLGRHVGRRADVGDLGGFGGGEDGRAEVGDLDVLAGGRDEQDVGRLDVAVGDALQVGVVERPRALEDDLDEALEGQQVVGLGEGFEGAAGDVFHHHVGVVVLDHRVVDLDDVRVLELAGEGGLVEQQVVIEVVWSVMRSSSGWSRLIATSRWAKGS